MRGKNRIGWGIALVGIALTIWLGGLALPDLQFDLWWMIPLAIGLVGLGLAGVGAVLLLKDSRAASVSRVQQTGKPAARTRPWLTARAPRGSINTSEADAWRRRHQPSTEASYPPEFHGAAAEPDDDELWEVTRDHGYVWRVSNQTGAEIRWATLGTDRREQETRIRPVQAEWERLPPSGRMRFEVIDPETRRVTLVIRWIESGTGAERSTTKVVVLR